MEFHLRAPFSSEARDMSLCDTNDSKVDAALLDDGVADTLVSGNTSAGYQRCGLPRVGVLAPLTKPSLRAATRSLAMDYANRVNPVVPGNHQDAEASRRPTSWAP